jgi:hypothetical protein
MADYYQHQDRRSDRVGARVYPRQHGDHTGVVLTGLAILMLGVLALLWAGQQTVVSPLPQPAVAVSQPSVSPPAPAKVVAAPAPVTVPVAPVVAVVAPVVAAAAPPATYAVAAAGDTRAAQP